MPLWKHDLDHLVFHHTDVYIPSNSLRAQQPAENGLETPLLRHHVLEGRSLAANAENADAADGCVTRRYNDARRPRAHRRGAGARRRTDRMSERQSSQ